MSKIKVFSLIAIILIIIGTIGSIKTFKMPVDRADWRSLNEEFEAANIENIVIEADNANIEILPHDDPTVRIKATGRNPEEDMNVEINGETLLIHLIHNRNKLFQFDIFSSVSSLKVYVPDKMFASIHAESDNGRIQGEGFKAKDVKVTTDNGLIELQYLVSDRILVEADNGKISLEGVEGDIQAETDNGAISLVTDNLDRNITLTTDVGMIDITTSTQPTNAEIIARVDLGNVNIFGHSNSHTTFGEGEYQVRLTTDIGKIKVK